MTPLARGSYVVHGDHPEHGLGRVIGVSAFATRVLFTRGGVRVFRAADTIRLKNVGTPAAADISALDSKMQALTPA